MYPFHGIGFNLPSIPPTDPWMIDGYPWVIPYLQAAPAAAGLRPLLIALRFVILDSCGGGYCHPWYPSLSFGGAVASALASWGPWDDLEALGSTRKDPLRSRLRFFLIWSGPRVTISKAFRVSWTEKRFCLIMLVSRFLFLTIWASGARKS